MCDGRRDALLKKRAEVLEQHQLYQATYVRETFKELSELLEKAAALLNSAAEQTTWLLGDTKAGLGIIDRELVAIDIEGTLHGAAETNIDTELDATEAAVRTADHIIDEHMRTTENTKEDRT